jgi:hypothetical protein
MEDGEDWLYRPMLAGLCDYKSLKDGTLDLVDVARMNFALDVKEENERRFYESNKRR